MKYFVLFILLFPLVLFSQLKIRAVVCNNNDEPLPFTNVALLNKYSGTVSDKNGRFELSGIDAKDSVKITNISYLPLILSIDAAQAADTIYLTEKVKSLDTLKFIAINKYKSEMQLGYSNSDNNGEFKLIPGNQIALFLQNTLSRPGRIDGITFWLKQKGKCNNSIRLRLLNANDFSGVPFRDILQKNIIISGKEIKLKNYIDLSDQRILMPVNGIFIVLEFLSTENNCEEDSYVSLSANLEERKNLVWLNFRDRNWSHFNIPRLPNQNYMTPNIGLKVLY